MSAPAPRKPLRERLEAAIHLSAGYLTRAVGENGRFVYLVNLDPDVDVPSSYNLLRHAGSMYALASYHERWPSKDIAAALGRAASYLRGTIGPLPEREDAHALWESAEREEAKLGGAGLALVAFVTRERASPGTAATSDLEGLAAFVTFMQKDNGGFYSKYLTSEGGRSDAWTSLYYPGEAALGLVMLHELVPDRGYRDAAVKALGYLADMRRGQDRVEPDHWALLATGRLFETLGPEDDGKGWPHPPSFLLTHALQICESILAGQQLDRESPIFGAFDPDARTTPTSTRLEGLLAALPLVAKTDDAMLKQKMRTSIDAGIAFLLAAQVTEGPHAGGMPASAWRRDGESAKSAHNPRATEIRIDYVQHALSAYLAYLDLLEGE